LEGSELSVLILTDGESVLPLASSQDHKRANDNDRGPNTGGMGAYSPCPLVNDQNLEEIVKSTGESIIKKLAEKGIVYRGILYVGLMLTDKGPHVLEYNVRFGDPETQAVLPRLKTDLLDILHQIAKGKLTTQSLEWDERPCVTVVMASGGYPGSYQKGFPVNGLEEAAQASDVVVFHAGTASLENGQIVTSGGRVLAVSALGETLKAARDAAYQAVQKISFKGAFYRGDIAHRALQSDVSMKNS